MAHRVQFRASILIALLLQACSVIDEPAEMQTFNYADIDVQMKNGLLTREGWPFTGIIYTLQPDGRDTSEIVCFNNGKEHGLWKKFYPGGKLMEKRYFDNGEKTGEYIAWWPNGVKKLAYKFKNGEYNGTCREWTDKGLLLAEMNYKNGYEEGRQRQYYDDGKIKANYIIADGRRYGLLGTKNCANVKDSISGN